MIIIRPDEYKFSRDKYSSLFWFNMINKEEK